MFWVGTRLWDALCLSSVWGISPKVSFAVPIAIDTLLNQKTLSYLISVGTIKIFL